MQFTSPVHSYIFKYSQIHVCYWVSSPDCCSCLILREGFVLFWRPIMDPWCSDAHANTVRSVTPFESTPPPSLPPKFLHRVVWLVIMPPVSVFWNMLTTHAQVRCKCVEYSESFLSLWLQVILLPLLCRKYQQTLEISTRTLVHSFTTWTISNADWKSHHKCSWKWAHVSAPVYAVLIFVFTSLPCLLPLLENLMLTLM